jgi:prevent-host-death family protein
MYRVPYNISYKLALGVDMTRTTDITSFTEHRQHLREHLDQCRASGRPLYVTTNGETDAVVLSAEAFDTLAEKAELAESLAMLDRGMDDIREGRTRNAKSALKSIAAELGATLDR